MNSYGKVAKDIRFNKNLNYSINVNGTLKEFMPDNSLVPLTVYTGIDSIDDSKCLIASINGVEISVARLVLGVFCGLIKAPINYKDGDIKNCKNKNLKYEINEIEYDTENDEYIIYGEVYKRVPGFENYYMSKKGTVYSKYSREFTKRTVSENGYYAITLSDCEGKRKPYKVHRLNWMTWNGPIPEDKIVDHKDTNRLNPSLDNLQLLTQRENVQKDADKIISRKLSASEVYQLRMLYYRGSTCAYLSQLFKVSLKSVYETIQFYNYKDYDRKPEEYTFTNDDIKDINYLYHISKMSLQGIANRYMTNINDIEQNIDINFMKRYVLEEKETVTMSAETAKEIYSRLQAGERGIDLANEYNVTNANISRIKRQFSKKE